MNNIGNSLGLSGEDKKESLEQINAPSLTGRLCLIAQSLQNPQDIAVKKSAKRAMKMLVGTAAMLPPTASMVTICNQLPDLIGKVF